MVGPKEAIGLVAAKFIVLSIMVDIMITTEAHNRMFSSPFLSYVRVTTGDVEAFLDA